jgi:hypothetical protein
MGEEEVQYIPQQDYYNLPSVPQTPKSDRPDLLDKIKPELIVEIIRRKLMGEENIGGEWKKVSYLQNRALTNIGSWELSNLMLGVSSINISISKLNDKEVKMRAYNIAKTAQRMCLANWKEYGIRNQSQLWFVHEIIFSNTLAVLKQADEASIQELLKGTITENRSVMQEQPRTGKLKQMLGLG